MRYRLAYGIFLGQRAGQEDCLLLPGGVRQESMAGVAQDAGEGKSLGCAVCDGMGGHAQGARSSRFVCERLLEALAEPPRTAEALRGLLRGVQLDLAAARLDGGTTVSGVVLRGRRALVFSAGDSRVYKLGPGGARRLTRDDSLVQWLVDRGEIPAEEARRHPHRNIIDFGLGDIFADAWERRGTGVACLEDRLLPGESYLLCTDGVHDLLDDPEIGAALEGPFPAGAEGLGGTLRARAHDNASFILVAGG